MAVGFTLSHLLGLPLQEAQARMKAVGLPDPVILRSLPARTRHALPEVVEWRVARARWQGDTPELVAVPSVPLRVEPSAP
jgi:hypothetical protein